MAKAVLERALDVEIADRLGYEYGDPASRGSGNSRNGHGRDLSSFESCHRDVVWVCSHHAML
jgi:transposase-like protein